MGQISEQFVEALRQLETSGDAGPIVGLFADGASLSNPLALHDEGSHDAARTFWSRYRGTFDEIASDFRHVQEAGDVAFLEWTSRGKLGGKPFSYEGVSIIEIANGRISAFRTYFDPKQIPTAVERPSPDISGPNTSGPKTSGPDTSGNANGSTSELEKGQREAAEQRAQGGYS